MFPQNPQLNGSVVTFAQLCPHCIRPVAQVFEHMPCEHKSPPVQTVPHAPQLFGSLIVLAHAMPHAESGAVHEHCPFVQLCPEPQALLQVPQWRRSVAVVTHCPTQLVCPSAHIGPVPPVAEPPVPVPETPPDDVPPVDVPPLPLSSSSWSLAGGFGAEQLTTAKSVPAASAANTKRACMGGSLTQLGARAMHSAS